MYQVPFQQPKEMAVEGIDRTVTKSSLGVRTVLEADFDGVYPWILGVYAGYTIPFIELVHRYVWISSAIPVSEGECPLVRLQTSNKSHTNLKTDKCFEPLLFLNRIAVWIRKSALTLFISALKLNAAVYTQSGITRKQSLQWLEEIV